MIGSPTSRASIAALAFSFLIACGGGTPPAASGPTGPTAGGAANADGAGTATGGDGSGSAAVASTARGVPQPAADPGVLMCKHVGEKPPMGVCGILEKAPRHDVNAPAVKRTIEVWKRLEGPFRALSGRESALVVLGPDARTGDGPDATPIPPAAYICPGAPPTVYVPATLLALVDDKDAKKYPEDFLAFVIGHELGHRMNDLTPDGCQLAAFQRPGKGANEEELADARAAFFITSAGYSASKVARADMVSRFLEAEYQLGREDTKTRKDALLGALQKFDSYEALYQTALAVALTGEMEAADRLLTWADELVQSHGVPLPELRVVRAIARIQRAAEMAPWLADLALPVGIEQLRCVPVHPGHSGLYEEPDKRVRGPDIGRGRKLLKEALALLDEAEARGATPLTVSAARACANLYLADASAAADAQARAESLAAAAPAAVQQALAGNRSLVTFLAFARGKQAPTIDDTDALEAWTNELEKTLGPAARSPMFASLLAALRNPTRKQPALGGDEIACSAKAVTAKLPELPAMGAHGSCPSGSSLAHALPSLDAAKQTGTSQGITVCTPAQGGGELAFVRLAATTEPPLAKLERALRTSRPPAGLDTLAAWACSCSAVVRQGVSDRGDVVYQVQCPKLAVERGVLIVRDGTVEQVIQHSR